MATTTLRPNSSSGPWTPGTGSISDAWQLLDTTPNDDTNLNTVQTNGGNFGNTLTLGWTTFTIPTLAQLRSVTPRFHIRITSNGGEPRWVDAQVLVNGVSAGTVRITNTGFSTLGWSGLAILASQTDVDGVTTGIKPTAEAHGGSIAEILIVSEAFLDILYNEAPTSLVTTPTEGSTVSNTNQPTTGSTYADPESDPVERYQNKIVSSATFTATGFDINTSGSVEDTGAVIGAITSRQIGVGLTNGTYRSYWRFADAGSGGRFGPWDFNEFTVQIDPAATPTTSSVVTEASSKVTVTVNARDDLLSANEASLETDAAGFSGHTNATVAHSTTQASHGTKSLQVDSVAAGDMVAGVSGVAPYKKKVVPGKTYTGIVKSKPNVTARTFNAGIRWLNAAGTELSISYGPDTAEVGGAFTQGAVIAVAPVGADAGVPVLKIQATGGAAERHFGDQWLIAPGSSAVWTRGGFVTQGQTNSGLTAEVQRSVDNGATWEFVRSGEDANVPNDYLELSLEDYELPRGVDVIYRSRITGTDGGNPFVGAWSASTAPVQLPLGSGTSGANWQLKNPLDPLQNLIVRPELFEFSTPEPQGVYRPIGRTTAVVTSDGVKSIEGSIAFLAKSSTEYANLTALLHSGATLLLQDPFGRQWYIRIGVERKTQMIRASDTSGQYPLRHLHRIQMDFVEVAAP